MKKHILFIDWNPEAFSEINPNSPIPEAEQKTPFYKLKSRTLRKAKEEAEKLIIKYKKYIYCVIIYERTEAPTQVGIFGTEEEYKAVAITKVGYWYAPSNEPELDSLYLIERRKYKKPPIYFSDPLK